MGMMDTVTTWARGVDVMGVADAVRVRAEEAGPPPVVTRLGTRSRQNFDRVVDALNRLPRPIMTLGTVALLAAGVIAPDWFTGRMEALSGLPEGVWWVIGGVLGLHFGARAQDKVHEAQREASVTSDLASVTPDRAGAPVQASPRGDAGVALGALRSGPNPVLDEWRAMQA